MRRSHRHTHKRRHDPMRLGGGMIGKLMGGVANQVGGLLGGIAGGFVKSAAPQTTVPIPGTSKGVNLATFGAGAVVSAFAPKTGTLGNFAQGFAGGMGAASDPVASQLGGGAVRYGGSVSTYGTLGV